MAPQRGPLVLAVTLLLVVLVVPLATMCFKSATFDEVAHLPAGYTYLETGVVRLNPQHPPLVKELCALPLLLMKLRPIDRQALSAPVLAPSFEWTFGRAFLYEQDADRILFWGRMPAVLMSVALAALVWIWARRLWGEWGGLLALVLYAFDPTIAAHSQFVTTDVGCALFSVGFVLLLRAYLARPTGGRRLIAGGALGLALGAKFSALVLLPVALVLLAARRWSRDRRAGSFSWRSLAAPACELALMTVVAGGVVWILYGLPADPLFYVRGLRGVNADHDASVPAYLMGALRVGGWRSYLAIATLVKTPLPELALLGLALAVALHGWRRLDREDALLALPCLAYFAGYSVSGDDLGVRYVIPCLPFAFVFAGRLAVWARRRTRAAAAALALLVSWCAVEYTAIAPDHLSYFNEAAGGWRGGIRWLADSNVDWGQGLIQLRNYLRSHPGDYWFCYFGSGAPEYYGIHTACLDASESAPPGGTLIVSAHVLAYWYAHLRQSYGDGPANWVAHKEPRAVVGHAYYVYDFP
jgi:hypothetical protein